LQGFPYIFMKNILILILSIVVLILLIKGCGQISALKKISDANDILSFEKDKLQNDFQKEIDENGQIVAKATSIFFENEELEKQLKDERLKKLKTKVEVQTETKFDTILVNVHDTIVIQNNDTIVKRFFEHKTDWISLKGEVHNHIVSINELIVHDSLDVQLGEERDGLFKTKNVVLVKSKNPNTDFKNVKSYEFPKKKKWYEKGGWKFASGVILTLIVISQI